MKDREMAEELISKAPAAIVTSINSEGYPQTRAMFNLRNKQIWPKLIPIFDEHVDDFMVLFTTNTSSSKIKDLKENPKVSVYYVLAEEWKGLMLSGDIEFVNDMKLIETIWHESWQKYYPKGFEDPDYTVLRLFPRTARGWNQSHTYQFSIGVPR